MGCDYYIDIFLKIEHSSGVCYIKLPCNRGYFCDCAWGIYEKEEDAEPYWHCEEAIEIRKKVEAFMLKPRPDVVIYSDKQYKSEYVKEKYEPYIMKKIEEKKSNVIRYTDTGKLKCFDDIISVTRFEKRYEPG